MRAARMRELPYPFESAVSIVSDIDSSNSERHAAYIDLLVRKHGLDFGDSVWLAGRKGEACGLAFFPQDLHWETRSSAKRSKSMPSLAEIVREHHRGNIDHFHGLLVSGPRVVVLPESTRDESKLVFRPSSERLSSFPFSVSEFFVWGVLLFVDTASASKVERLTVVEEPARSADHSARRIEYEREVDSKLFPMLDTEFRGVRQLLFRLPDTEGANSHPPLAERILRLTVEFTAGQRALGAPRACLLNSHTRLILDRLAYLYERLHVSTNLLTTHSGWHFMAQQELNGKKNRLSLERFETHPTAFEERWGVVLTPKFGFSTMADDEASFCRLYPELARCFGMRFLVPYPFTARRDESFDVFDVVYPSQSRVGNVLHVLQRTLPSVPNRYLPRADEETTRHARASSFSLRLESILTASHQQKGGIWPYYTHLGHVGKRATVPSPYLEEAPIAALRNRAFGIGERSGRLWVTRPSTLCDYSYAAQKLPPAVTRPDCSTIAIRRIVQSDSKTPYPWSPFQLYGATFYVQSSANARVLLDGAEVRDIVRNTADETGEESVTIAACAIRHPVSIGALGSGEAIDSDTDVAHRATGIEPSWAFDAAGSRVVRLTLRDSTDGAAAQRAVASGQLLLETPGVEPEGCQHFFYAVRRSAPDVRFGIVLRTKTGGTFYFGDSDVPPTDLVLTASYVTRSPDSSPAKWVREVIPLYGLNWNVIHEPYPLPSHPTASVSLLANGAPGEWVEVATVEFGRPRTTLLPDQLRGAVIGGVVEGPHDTRVRLRPVSGEGESRSQTIGADCRGFFHFEPIPHGTYEISAADDGGRGVERPKHYIDVRGDCFDIRIEHPKLGDSPVCPDRYDTRLRRTEPSQKEEPRVMRPNTLAELQRLASSFEQHARRALETRQREQPKIADRFYLENRQGVLSGLQRHMALEVLKTIDVSRTLLDVGCGFGEFPVFLATQGYRTIGVEVEDARYEGMRFLATKLREVFPGLETRFTAVNGSFPNEAPKSDVLVFCNTVNRHFDANIEAIIASFTRYESALLDLRTFGRLRASADEQEELRAKISAAGHAVDTLASGTGLHIVRVHPSN